MGLFNKKKKKEEKKEVPSLPELPKLPELPSLSNEKNLEPIHQLPSFPNDSLGEKFSQNTIKKAITGKKGGESALEMDDDSEEELEEHGMSRGHLNKQTRREIPENFESAIRKVKETEPIFIRIDKFEESLNLIEKTKKQILEVEKMLKDIKKIKEDEEEELEVWEREIQTAKEQIGKVDEDIFSKIE